MATTHRSDLVEQLEKALTEEAYDGGMGVLSPEQFTKLVRTLATTAAAVVAEAQTSMDVTRRAPLQGTRGIGPAGTIAWAEHLEVWEAYARRYGRAQGAERIAERGGFGQGEVRSLLGREPRTFVAEQGGVQSR